MKAVENGGDLNMKKCKNCQKEIDGKAKKCPYCQTDQRNWFMRHKITSAILILIVLGAIGSAGGKSTSNQPKQVQVEEKVQEPMRITADELADDFDANQVAAEKKWSNKLVEFSAVVTNITDSGLSFGKVGSKTFSTTQISCRVNNKDQLLSLKNGETVTVKGVIGNQTLGVIDMSNCEVVK